MYLHKDLYTNKTKGDQTHDSQSAFFFLQKNICDQTTVIPTTQVMTVQTVQLKEPLRSIDQLGMTGSDNTHLCFK